MRDMKRKKVIIVGTSKGSLLPKRIPSKQLLQAIDEGIKQIKLGNTVKQEEVKKLYQKWL
jgi:hypothetical protein